MVTLNQTQQLFKRIPMFVFLMLLLSLKTTPTKEESNSGAVLMDGGTERLPRLKLLKIPHLLMLRLEKLIIMILRTPVLLMSKLKHMLLTNPLVLFLPTWNH
ncbi:unnamed protein product [Ambrosiozyma monospora]|uniref:Unnamed protein product n=1 Tax=Ambrosiozyma monospora TaxID=43982 RepID=A0ACB5UDR2_AMBMO|nr:unnamed protein product [Ambrosiozyma monospora]